MTGYRWEQSSVAGEEVSVIRYHVEFVNMKWSRQAYLMQKSAVRRLVMSSVSTSMQLMMKRVI
jgi:hypothetical protein